jgi:hypothetical protein
MPRKPRFAGARRGAFETSPVHNSNRPNTNRHRRTDKPLRPSYRAITIALHIAREAKAALSELFSEVKEGDIPVIVFVRFDGWQVTNAGERAVKQELRKIVYVKYKIKAPLTTSGSLETTSSFFISPDLLLPRAGRTR